MINVDRDLERGTAGRQEDADGVGFGEVEQDHRHTGEQQIEENRVLGDLRHTVPVAGTDILRSHCRYSGAKRQRRHLHVIPQLHIGRKGRRGV